VRAGQPLFRIDAAPYQAALESAQAQLARAQANLAQATATAERYKPLAEAKAISQQDYANAAAAQKTAEADVAAGRAAVLSARINVGYAQVTAPIAGRIGRALVTEGALVSAAEATPLALIQQVGTVYVNFTQSSAEVLKLRKALAAGQLRRAAGPGAEPVTVRVVLEDGTELPRPGKLLFSDLTVDASTGQVTLRAEVPNPDGLVLPGQYVRVRLSQAELPAAVLVPQQAVTRSAQGDTVLLVGEGNKPGPRPVTLAGSQNGQWVVTGGLQPGDKVIVDGFQKMMVPGAPVTPVPWQPGGAKPMPAASAAPAAAASVAAAASSASR
jgi:membrane fusion protein (multidrug efflux system)